MPFGGRHEAVGPELGDGLIYTQASTGGWHGFVIRSGGLAVARGNDGLGQCCLPELALGLRGNARIYIRMYNCGRGGEH